MAFFLQFVCVNIHFIPLSLLLSKAYVMIMAMFFRLQEFFKTVEAFSKSRYEHHVTGVQIILVYFNFPSPIMPTWLPC